LTSSMSEIAKAAGRDAGPEQSARMNISPGQEILVLSADGFQNMRWGMIMSGRKNARGRPVMETIVNVRSETLFQKSAFEGVKRAIVPANGWYEWTGKRGRKKAWRIQARTGKLLWFAAVFDVWTAPGGLDVAQVATVTCEPNADVRDIHHRMGALLDRDNITAWLEGQDVPLDPAPDGSLLVEPAHDVNWNGP